MVNFGFGSASILGIFLAVAGAALYFLRSVRPELSRDHDIFFAAVGLLCGFILLFQGWRLDPILQFGQLLLTGSAVFFAVESIKLRGVATEQAKRNTRIVDDEREVSPYYEAQEAQIDGLELEDEEYRRRPRIEGSRDTRRTRRDEYYDETPRRTRRDEYNDEPPGRSSSRVGSVDKLGQGEKRRKPQQRSSRSVSRPIERPEDDEWGNPQRSDDDWDVSSSTVRKSSRPSNNGSSGFEKRNSDISPRPKKRRPPQDSVSQRESDAEATPTDYVDYKPVERPDDEPDNSANFNDL